MILLGILLATALWFYLSYTTVIKRKNKVEEAFSSIDVQLKKRYDLIPNILNMTKKFMEHERSLFEDITNLRTKALSLGNDIKDISEKLAIDSEIKAKMGQILVSVENYPELKSDSTMVTAMQTYNEVEEHIAAARRFYNSAVNELNNAVEIFPTSMYAKKLGITKQEFYKTDEPIHKSINVNDYLN